MALDSLEKRRTVPGVGRPWMRMKHPVATPDVQWRMAVGLTYGDVALAQEIPTVIVRSPQFLLTVGKMMNP